MKERISASVVFMAMQNATFIASTDSEMPRNPDMNEFVNVTKIGMA